MPQFSTTHRVRHSADEMFDLVADVERYPEFVPFCRGLKVLRRAPGEGQTEILTADMTVAYKLIREKFTSRVTLDRPRQQIFVEYLNGPFSRLDNRWTFRPVNDQLCDVDFYISYEFRSRALGFIMGAMFDIAFRYMVGAFERRADQIYAPGAAQT
jgi:coenzyme Q-binding protein COQ10